jgi:hypothetical protein
MNRADIPKPKIRVDKSDAPAIVSMNDVFAVARENNFGAAIFIYKNPEQYEWGITFENGEVFSRLELDPEKLRQAKNRTLPDMRTDLFKKMVIEGRDQYSHVVDINLLEAMKADPFKKAVIEERDLLTGKIVAMADSMVNKSAFTLLPAEEQNLLKRQFALMRAYKQVLDERIFNFSRSTDS